MNLLAHALLADGTPESVLGNLVADFIRPLDLSALPPRVRDGVLLHRHVDAFTDRHPLVQRSIRRIGHRWGWFSGILIDVYYDHILAIDWGRYCDVSLRDFTNRVNEIMVAGAERVPESAAGAMRHFAATDRLMSYGTPDGSGIEEALRRLSDRIAERMPKRAVRLDEAMPDLRAAHPDLAVDFHAFFPELRAFAAGWKPPA